MVSKITVFEPHIEGAQFGPASLGRPDATGDASVSTSETGAEETSGAVTSRFSKARAALLVLPLAAVLLGGTMAWRRFRAGRRHDDQAADPAEPATIEERIPTAANTE